MTKMTVAEAVAKFPATFALRNHAGLFRVSPWSCYEGSDGIQIVFQIQRGEEWLDYTRQGLEESLSYVVIEAGERFNQAVAELADFCAEKGLVAKPLALDTLAQLNTANAERLQNAGQLTRTWCDLTLAPAYAVGKCGSQTGRRGTAGTKAHLLFTETVVGDTSVDAGHARRVGKLHRVTGCNGNGQMTGVVVKGADLDQVTCSKCLKRLAELRAIIIEALEDGTTVAR